MYFQQFKQTIKLFLLVMFVAGCAATSPDTGVEYAEEPKDEELIELINTRQVKPPDMLTEAEKQNFDQRIAELEQYYRESQDELNRLKSEILLRDEKIRQLENQLMAVSGQKTEEAAQQQAEPVADTAVPISEFVEQYRRALNSFMTRDYQNALTSFQVLLEKDTQHILSDNCQYWIGESYYALKDYRSAIIAFEKVFTYFRSNKDDDAQLKISLCYFQLGDMVKAKEEIIKLINNYPASEYILRAQNLLDKIG
ncbi:tetratricopeptide repeat protein [candidate division KSB1 bacterium]